ncbi:MAG: hypothetical protein Pyrs2KO_30340 [Pyruvatibacter sp.]
MAAWQAFEEAPLASARVLLDPLAGGRSVEQVELIKAQALLQQSDPIRVARNTSYGRALLAELRFLDASERKDTASMAGMAFRESLVRRPNAPGAWRGLLASEVNASGRFSRLRGPLEGALQLDKGDAFTSLMVLEIVLQASDTVDMDLGEMALPEVSKHEVYWRTRPGLGRLYVSLDAQARSTMLANMKNPEAFDTWSKRFKAQ